MALIKCPNCGLEVSSKAERCPKCDHTINLNSTRSRNEQEKIVNFFITYANVVRILSYILAFIVFIISISVLEDSDGTSIIFGIISTVLIVLSGIITENIFKWLAYILKNLHEINAKTK